MIRSSLTKIKRACGVALGSRAQRPNQCCPCCPVTVKQKRGLKTRDSDKNIDKETIDDKECQKNEIRCIYGKEFESIEPIKIDGDYNKAFGIHEIFSKSFTQLVTPNTPDNETGKCDKCKKLIDLTYGNGQIPNNTTINNKQCDQNNTHVNKTQINEYKDSVPKASTPLVKELSTMHRTVVNSDVNYNTTKTMDKVFETQMTNSKGNNDHFVKTGVDREGKELPEPCKRVTITENQSSIGQLEILDNAAQVTHKKSKGMTPIAGKSEPKDVNDQFETPTVDDVKLIQQTLNVNSDSNYDSRKILDKDMKLQMTNSKDNHNFVKQDINQKGTEEQKTSMPTQITGFSKSGVCNTNVIDSNIAKERETGNVHTGNTNNLVDINENDNLTEDDGSMVYASTTRREEELPQKVEHIDEPQVVVNKNPENEGFNVTPRILGNNYKYTTYEKEDNKPNVAAPAKYDDVVKRSLDTPVSHVDEILLREMEKLGIPLGTKSLAGSPMGKNIIQTDILKNPHRYADKEYFEFVNQTSDTNDVQDMTPKHTMYIHEKVLIKDEDADSVELELERIIRELPLLSKNNIYFDKADLVKNTSNKEFVPENNQLLNQESEKLHVIDKQLLKTEAELKQDLIHMSEISKTVHTDKHNNVPSAAPDTIKSILQQYQKQVTEETDRDRIHVREVRDHTNKNISVNDNRFKEDNVERKTLQNIKHQTTISSFTNFGQQEKSRKPARDIKMIDNAETNDTSNSKTLKLQQNFYQEKPRIQKQEKIKESMTQKVDEISLGLGIVAEPKRKPPIRKRTRPTKSTTKLRQPRSKRNIKIVDESQKIIEFTKDKANLKDNTYNFIDKQYFQQPQQYPLIDIELNHPEHRLKGENKTLDAVPIMQDAVESKSDPKPDEGTITTSTMRGEEMNDTINVTERTNYEIFQNLMKGKGISEQEYASLISKALGPDPSLDDKVPLSELLERVRKRNRLMQLKNILSSLIVAQAELGKCDQKAPGRVPAAPRSTPLNQITPPPCNTQPACKPKAKNKFTPASEIPSFAQLTTISKDFKDFTSLKELTPPSKANLTEEIIEKLQNLGKKLEPKNVRALDELSHINHHIVIARTYEPWTPIPSWPTPKKPKRNKLVCPKHGCQIPPPRLIKDPPATQHPCAGFPKKLFSTQEIFIVPVSPIRKKKVYDIGEY